MRLTVYGDIMNEKKMVGLSARYQSRRDALMQVLAKKHGIGAVMITHPVDIRYLSGAREGVSALLLDPGQATLFTSKMFEVCVPKEAPGCNVLVGKQAFEESGKILRGSRYRRGLGYQGSKLVQSRFQRLASDMGHRKLVDIGEAVAQLRTIKDAGELRSIRQCVRIAQQAFGDLTKQGAAYLMARSERQLAAELEYRMCMLGADRQAFPFNGIIMAAGPHSASCHHFPGSRKPRKGEPLLIDWGAEKDGYRSDITRVVFMGEPSVEMRGIYEVVRAANVAGIQAVQAGVLCTSVSDAGWNVVRDAGYGDYIRHGLGHGVGLEIHEPPGIGSGGSQEVSAKSARLEADMVVTVEPGIYLDGKGGVRLEDDVLVTTRGHKVLTSLPKDLESAILPV
jgi:Xaa-Pro aminopeptidase